MKDIILISHVISGSLVLLIGLVLMLIKKGNKLHIRLGWLYVLSMWWVCLSAFISITFFDFSLFLLVIGILTFYSTFHGIRVIRRAKRNLIAWYDYLVTGLVSMSGLGLIGYGLYLLVAYPDYVILAILSIVFGIFTFYGSFKDLYFFLKPKNTDKDWWIYQHIGAMGGSYIAAITAFAVQNGQLFSLPGSMAWLPWVLPGVVGSFILSKVISGYRKNKIRARY